MGRFAVFFLSHTDPGFQLWFYFHLCMWVVHWDLLLRLPWRTWICPSEAQVWRWYSCLGWRASGSTRYPGELMGREAGKFLLYWLCQSLWLCGSPQTVEILKEMGIPDHLTCLLRSLYVGQEATVRTGHGTDWIQIGIGVCKVCIFSSCLFKLYAEYIMRNAGLNEAQAEIKIVRRK